MEPEQVVKKSKSAWRTLFVGFLFGVLASFMVLVVIACKWAPRSENIEVDLYSGHIITYKSFLWKRSRIHQPKEPHVQWAIQHQYPVKSWYRGCGGFRRGWFERELHCGLTTRSYVYAIYSLQIPEEEKIKLLHQYHKDLDALKLKEQEYRKYYNFMEPFYTNWDKKLETIIKDLAEVTSTF